VADWPWRALVHDIHRVLLVWKRQRISRVWQVSAYKHATLIRDD